MSQISKEDPLLSLLTERSFLTKAQVETLLIELSFPEKGKYKEKGAMRNVSKGAFKRVLSQAARNVKKTVYTLLLLAYVGIIDEVFVNALGDILPTLKMAATLSDKGKEKVSKEIIKIVEDMLSLYL